MDGESTEISRHDKIPVWRLACTDCDNVEVEEEDRLHRGAIIAEKTWSWIQRQLAIQLVPWAKPDPVQAAHEAGRREALEAIRDRMVEMSEDFRRHERK